MKNIQLTNFRDLGGLIGFEGRPLKNKLLLRAGQPVGMSSEDIEILTQDYQLAHIIDFRGEREILEHPVDEVGKAQYLNIDILAADMKKDNNAPTLESMIQHLKPGVADAYMVEAYRKFVLSDDARQGYRQFIDTLLEAKGSLLFHCFAGKDRTGWGAAIILKLLGVSDEDIMTDYLATIEGRKAENSRMMEEYRQKGLPEEKLAILEEMMSVKASYLESALAAVEKEYGSFQHYLEQALKVTDSETAQLREIYLSA